MQQTNLTDLASQQVNTIIRSAIAQASEKGTLPQAEMPDFVVEIPGDTSHGDFASNVAMVGARTWRKSPPQIAAAILEELDFSDSYFLRAEVAGPGFLNFFLKSEWFTDNIALILERGDDWGKTDYGKGEKVMVEFVSANPTGPMHLGNARGGVIGDTLVAAMQAAGYNATREFYLNDAGNQIEKFGLSLEVRYLQQLQGEDSIEFPEDGYHGEDITQRVKEYIAEFGDSLLQKPTEERRQALVDYALPKNIDAMRKTLEDYRITYDVWFRESTIYQDGTLDKMMGILKEKGLAYEQDGAIWYKALEFGAEKDEVLIRQNGNPTYFAADIAYHYNKFAVRGFERCINIWGADHHGHVARLQGSMDAIGLRGDKLDIILMQLVRLLKGGEPYRMSKRSGQSVTLGDLLEMVPVDAARFFFNMREAGSAMDFDLDLAVEQSSKNPVYYIQYAHARICSLTKRLAEENIAAKDVGVAELSLLTHPSEIELIRTLAAYPNTIIGAAKRYDTASLTHYALDAAMAYHKFYDDCRILVEDREKDADLMQARIALCKATRITIANLLHLLKINAPESM